MFNLAQEQIFDRYKNPQCAGEIEDANFKAEGVNPVCGDELLITATLTDEGIVKEMRHKSRACAICTAAADTVCEESIGKTLEEIRRTSSNHIIETLGIPLSPLRLKCALLPLETIKQK